MVKDISCNQKISCLNPSVPTLFPSLSRLKHHVYLQLLVLKKKYTCEG